MSESELRKIRKAFGLAVRRKRNKLKLSQEEFAEKADIHRTYVSSIELGKVAVGIEVIYKMAKALGIPLYRLVQQAEKNL